MKSCNLVQLHSNMYRSRSRYFMSMVSWFLGMLSRSHVDGTQAEDVRQCRSKEVRLAHDFQPRNRPDKLLCTASPRQRLPLWVRLGEQTCSGCSRASRWAKTSTYIRFYQCRSSIRGYWGKTSGALWCLCGAARFLSRYTGLSLR